MQKKSILVIILTVVIFLSATILGVSTVYRVNEVTLKTQTISKEAEGEAIEIQQELQDAYYKASIFSTDDALAKEIIAKFPYFRILKFEKDFPNRLVIEISEDEEVYAVETGAQHGKYFILNQEGTVLGIRDDYINRAIGLPDAKNVLIKGLQATGNKGELIAGDDVWVYVLPLCQQISMQLNGIRRNIVTVEVIKGGSSQNTVSIKMTTIEGVNLYIGNPASLTVEKANKIVDAYLKLNDVERTKGMLVVYEVNKNVTSMYSPNDTFENLP